VACTPVAIAMLVLADCSRAASVDLIGLDEQSAFILVNFSDTICFAE
jgi:hypothetical protein